jgi:gluconate 2-dehydrogenase gamma chain
MRHPETEHDDRNGEQPSPRRGLTRRSLLEQAGVTAAALGLAGCGVSEQRRQVATDVDAPQLAVPPPSQPPLNCQIFSFFTPTEARTVDAFTVRLAPGDASDPGAREACVVTYIDAKLARFPGFATPTFFEAPFAKPVDSAPSGAQAGAQKEILVDKKDLPRYGFQASLTSQDAYRRGLEQLDLYTTTKYGSAFVDLIETQQDAVLKALEKANPSSPSVARKQKDMADPRKALKQAKAKHEQELKTADQQLLAKLFKKPSAYGFFSMLQDDTNEGLFADPSYGGNRDFAGWKLVRYPGAQRAWTPYELTHGPQHRQIQGLAQMPAMHPGVPQDHAILPLHGTEASSTP